MHNNYYIVLHFGASFDGLTVCGEVDGAEREIKNN